MDNSLLLIFLSTGISRTWLMSTLIENSISFSNLSKEEWSTIRNFRNRNDIVIKPADKGGAVVVWRTDLYKEEASRQLSDSTLGKQRLYHTTSEISQRHTMNSINLVHITPRNSHQKNVWEHKVTRHENDSIKWLEAHSK